MPYNKQFAYRVELIDQCLGNPYRQWTLKDIVDKVNEALADRFGTHASKRTIQQDLKYLKEEKGAPIAKKKSGTTTYFFYENPHYSIQQLPVDEEEITLLKQSINILRQVSDFHLVQEVDDIISRLENKMNLPAQDQQTIIQFEDHHISSGATHIDTFLEAIRSRLCLRVTYQSFRENEPRTFVFHPYLLKEFRNRWFVLGRMDDAAHYSTLALDRIRKVNNSSCPYRTNDLFNPNTFFENVIGVSVPEGATVEPIDIRVKASLMPYVQTKPIHPSQQLIKTYVSGEGLIRITIIVNYELKSVLLSYGSDIDIIQPATLRQQLHEIYHQAFRQYEKE
jgi:predicted DNA-binding transcriptional regulator YafY